MSDEDWDLWAQYANDKQSFEEFHGLEEMDDEEYMQLIKELHAA